MKDCMNDAERNRTKEIGMKKKIFFKTGASKKAWKKG